MLKVKNIDNEEREIVDGDNYMEGSFKQKVRSTKVIAVPISDGLK